jgi:glycosyltransferase involved in cell wall biosynthesis
MKIAIDISQIVHRGTGIARYTKELIETLLKYDKKNDYMFFFSSLRQKLERNMEAKIKEKHLLKKIFLPPTILEFLWNRLHILSIDNFVGRNDLVLTSDWTEPPSQSKKITTIHDLVYLKFAETLDKKIVNVQKRRLKWVKKESNLIIADSFATKNDIVELLKIPENKIQIINPAVETINPTNLQIKKTLKKYKIRRPFILTVGKIEPRKNLERLIKAFIKAKLTNVDLIIVGPKGWSKENQQSAISNQQYKNLKFLGFIPDIELYSLYKSALFFIYPSIYEGFGYPVVEAMKLGCPIVTSYTSSLKEIAEGCALLFNPYSEDEIAKTIITMYRNENLRKQLKERGKKRGKDFSQQKFAYNLLSVFEKVYGYRSGW